MGGLERLVNDSSTLVRAWEREVVHSTALGDFDDVFSVEAAQQLLRTSLPLAAARLFRDGGFLPGRLMARPQERRGRNAGRLADADRVMEQVRGGATLAVEELQLYSPTVADFAAEIARETGYDTECTAFLTPVRANGAGPHRDPVSFFLRQIHGSKRWRVWAAETGEIADRPAPSVLAQTAPELDVVLKEGDCLYIPRGRIHVGETLDEPSVHLSFGIFQCTWATALARAVESIAEEIPALRELVPPRHSDVDVPGLFRDRLALLLVGLGEADWQQVDPRSGAAPTRKPPGLQEALDHCPQPVPRHHV